MNKKKSIFVIIICIFVFLFAGCSDGDIADEIIKDNIDDLYLVVLDIDDCISIEIDNLTVSYNQFDSKYSERKHKLMLLSEVYVKTVDLEKIKEIKKYICDDGFWLLFPCTNKDEVNNLAHKFGKSINCTESNYIIGYSLLYNYTQGFIQGIPHYTSKNTLLDSKVCNSLIKQSFRDMIENRFEDKS